jgi:hypothetical protein
MGVFFGVVLIVAGAVTLVTALRHRRENPRLLPASVVGLLLGIFLVLYPRIALANLHRVDMSHPDDWITNPAASPTSQVHWEGNTLVGSLEVGSGHYGVFPADWDANRFQATWDITFTQLDRPGDMIPLTLDDQKVEKPRTSLDYASVAIGVMDPGIANIDDRDHVSGSGIEACFSTDIRLRASDANYLVRTSSSTESGKATIDPTFKPGQPIRIELNKKYHCSLGYDALSNSATLVVKDDAGQTVCDRRLEDLKDFTNSVSWFGVSVRGFNRFDKRLDPDKLHNGYVRPKTVFKIENLEYRQP